MHLLLTGRQYAIEALLLAGGFTAVLVMVVWTVQRRLGRSGEPRRLIGGFNRATAHKIRTPLQAILHYCLTTFMVSGSIGLVLLVFIGVIILFQTIGLLTWIDLRLIARGAVAFVLYKIALAVTVPIPIVLVVCARLAYDAIRSTSKSHGPMQLGDTLFYYYSDPINDARDGFYFVGEQELKLLSEIVTDSLVTIIELGDIVDVQLVQEQTSPAGGEITLHLSGGPTVTFPVSSAWDEDLVQVIRARAPRISDIQDL